MNQQMPEADLCTKIQKIQREQSFFEFSQLIQAQKRIINSTNT